MSEELDDRIDHVRRRRRLLAYLCARWVGRTPSLETGLATAAIALEAEGHARVLAAADGVLRSNSDIGPSPTSPIVTWDSWAADVAADARLTQDWERMVSAANELCAADIADLEELRGVVRREHVARLERVLEEARPHAEFFAALARWSSRPWPGSTV